MDKKEIIKTIAKRTGGDIYLGVVGPVRCGKSTFIKKMVETLIVPNIEDVNPELLQDQASQNVITTLYNFENVLKSVVDKNEPSILARYLIELATAFSNFYNDNKIIDEDETVKNSRVYLAYAVSNTLKVGAKLLGIDMPNRM